MQGVDGGRRVVKKRTLEDGRSGEDGLLLKQAASKYIAGQAKKELH